MERTSSMDLGLYDMDLSLFGGDLLVGLQPTSAELKVTQDGQKSLDAIGTWATSGLDVSLGQDEPANSTSLSTSVPVMEQPLGNSWMDSRVDLLNLLAQEGEHALVDNAALISSIREEPTEDSAIKLLQSVAEETSQMLAAGTDPGLDSTAVAQAADDLAQSVVDIGDGTTSVDHLLDMLCSGVAPAVDMDTTVGGMPVDSDILTSVTAEDVESILSSEPSSPAVPIPTSPYELAPSPYNELPPEQSNSLLAKYLVGDLGTTSQTSQSPTFDLSDLDSMTSDDDSDYIPPSVRTSKVRGSPYSRNKAKPGPKSKNSVDKESRALDRKLRKKQQNKDAATRYRMKKREEASLIDQECNELEDRNTELKDKVEQMTREIGYLKNLLAEVYKARGLIAPKKLGK